MKKFKTSSIFGIIFCVGVIILESIILYVQHINDGLKFILRDRIKPDIYQNEGLVTAIIPFIAIFLFVATLLTLLKIIYEENDKVEYSNTGKTIVECKYEGNGKYSVDSYSEKELSNGTPLFNSVVGCLVFAALGTIASLGWSPIVLIVISVIGILINIYNIVCD